MSSHSGSPEGSQTCLDSDAPEGRCKALSLPNLRVLEPNDQIRELQTIIRDRYMYIHTATPTVCHLCRYSPLQEDKKNYLKSSLGTRPFTHAYGGRVWAHTHI